MSAHAHDRSAAGLIRGVIAAGVGLLVLRLVVSNGYLSYVKPGMRSPLLLSAVILVGLGLWSCWATAKATDGDGSHGDHAHNDHAHHRDRTSGFILVPLAILAVGSPAALGSDMVASARRAPIEATIGPARSGRTSAPGVTRSGVPVTVVESEVDPTASLQPKPIAPPGEVVPRTVNRFVGEASLWPTMYDGVTVELTGFVAGPAERGNGFQIARFRLVCCAADALVSVADVVGDAALDGYPPDTWVRVQGQVDPTSKKGAIALNADSVSVIEQPTDPYEVG